MGEGPSGEIAASGDGSCDSSISLDCSGLTTAVVGASVATAVAAGAAVAASLNSIWRAKAAMVSCSCGCAKSLFAIRRTALFRVSA